MGSQGLVGFLLLLDKAMFTLLQNALPILPSLHSPCPLGTSSLSGTLFNDKTDQLQISLFPSQEGLSLSSQLASVEHILIEMDTQPNPESEHFPPRFCESQDSNPDENQDRLWLAHGLNQTPGSKTPMSLWGQSGSEFYKPQAHSFSGMNPSTAET